MEYSLSNMLRYSRVLKRSSPSGPTPVIDLQFAADGTLTARTGPTPTFTRASAASYVNSSGYVVNALINAPRFEYDSVTLVRKGLLIEEGRTNLNSYSSGEFTNSYWETTASNVTATDLVTTDPKNIPLSAGSLTEIAGVSVSRHMHQTTGPFTPAANSPYTMSAWVKKPSSDGIQFVQLAFWIAGFGSTAYMNFDIQNGVVGTGGAGVIGKSITAYPNGWYRITATAISVASPGLSGFQLGFSTSSSAARTEAYTAVAPLKSIYLWGTQMEAGWFPTSYIFTYSSTAVRAADVCSITGSGFTAVFSTTEGSVFSNGSAPTKNFSASESYFFSIATGPFNIYNSFEAGNFVRPKIGISTIYTYQPTSKSYTPLGVAKQSIGYKVGQLSSSYLNNVAYSGGTNANLGSIFTGSLYIGSSSSSANYLNGTIDSIQYYSSRLTDAQLQTLTV